MAFSRRDDSNDQLHPNGAHANESTPAQVLYRGSHKLHQGWKLFCSVDAGELSIFFEAVLVLTEGPCFVLHGSTQEEVAQLTCIADTWRSTMEGGAEKCMVSCTHMADATDLILLPIPGCTAAPFNGFILGFHVSKGAAWSAKHVLQRCCMPLVLDLDETLLVANSSSGLARKLNWARSRRAKILEAVEEWQDRDAMRGQLQAIDAEEAVVAEDLAYLSEYMHTDAVTFDGVCRAAKMEVADATISRPVIRCMDRGFVLTRIDPALKETSMLVRIRPGWEELKALILGQNPRETRPQPVKRKYEVFVCTASQRAYALEVWRLLDPGGHIIEPGKLQARLVNVPPPRCKTLSLACNLGAAVSEERSVFPMAIIADDRLDVWQAADQPHIVRVEEYLPYQRAAEIKAAPDPGQLPWLTLHTLRDKISKIRSNFYFQLHFILRPVVAGTQPAAQAMLKWPRLRTVAELVKDPMLAAPPPNPPPGESPRTGKPDIEICIPHWQPTSAPTTTQEDPCENLSFPGPSQNGPPLQGVDEWQQSWSPQRFKRARKGAASMRAQGPGDHADAMEEGRPVKWRRGWDETQQQEAWEEAPPDESHAQSPRGGRQASPHRGGRGRQWSPRGRGRNGQGRHNQGNGHSPPRRGRGRGRVGYRGRGRNGQGRHNDGNGPSPPGRRGRGRFMNSNDVS